MTTATYGHIPSLGAMLCRDFRKPNEWLARNPSQNVILVTAAVVGHKTDQQFGARRMQLSSSLPLWTCKSLEVGLDRRHLSTLGEQLAKDKYGGGTTLREKHPSPSGC